MGRLAMTGTRLAAALAAAVVVCALTFAPGAQRAVAQQVDFTAAIGAEAAVMQAAAASMTNQASEPDPDYSWYDEAASTFTLSTDYDANGSPVEGRTVVNKLIALRNIVNGMGGAP